MKAILALFAVLGIPFAILNMLGGIVSGIWLAILGDWGSIGHGLLAMIISSLVLGIALMPSLLLVGPSAYFAEKGFIFLFYVFAFLSSIYVVAVITAWCGAVLYFFAGRATSYTWIPILIWSYGVALGPWQWMAQKEAQGGNGEASLTTTFFAQIGYVVMILTAMFMQVTIFDVLLIFVVIMLIGLIFQFAATIQGMRTAREDVNGYDELHHA
ncbi:MAG: hypothetical protein H8E14_14330 [Candidatus Marinimicrobia bacterium]|nr:hypothetical protein [Candidatus Neomarinimicrobiota bacterium]